MPWGSGDALTSSNLNAIVPTWYGSGKVYDVTYYGAKHDGATDDSAAIQSAINACGVTGGGVVFLPPGLYVVNATLAINYSKVTLAGAGMEATTLNFNGAPAAAHGVVVNGAGQVNGIQEVVVRDLCIQQAKGTGLYFQGRGVWGAGNNLLAQCEVSNVLIDRPTRKGLWLESVELSQFRNVYVSAPTTQEGIYLANGCTSCAFIACYVRWNAGTGLADGYYMENTAYCTFNACGCDNPGLYGYHVKGNGNQAASIVFTGCGCEIPGGDVATGGAWEVEGAVNATGKATSIVLVGCYANGLGTAAAPSFLLATAAAGGFSDVLVINCYDVSPAAAAVNSILANATGAGTSTATRYGGTFALPFGGNSYMVDATPGLGWQVPEWAANMAVNANFQFVLVISTSDIAASLNAPTSAPGTGYYWKGVILTVVFRNASGGAMVNSLAFAGGAGGFRPTSTGNLVAPANTKTRTIQFVFDPGLNAWVELGRTILDS